MTDSASIHGHRFSPNVLEDVRRDAIRKGASTPGLILIEAGIARNANGDHYLNGGELASGLADLAQAGVKRPSFGAYSSLRNLYRDVKDRLGEPLDHAPENCVGTTIAGTGPAGRDTTISALLVKNEQGDPTYPRGNQPAPVYIEIWESHSAPKFYGPFPMTAQGLLATPETPRTFASDRQIDFDALRYVFGDTRLGSGADFFGPLPVTSTSSRKVQSEVFYELFNGTPARVLRRESGNSAIKAILDSAFDQSEHHRLMKHVLGELMQSGAIKGVQYYRAEAGREVVSSSDALVLIDRTGQAAAFKVGTL